ncbi:MAG: hypothetical protein FWD04_10305 [Conexibacteraceae bacterium]|nr:hypothetical protein [Conexibacteraceae bacterium]
MRRLAAALPALVVLVALYLIATRGGAHHPNPTPPSSPSAARPAATTTSPSQPITSPRTIPATRTAPPHTPHVRPAPRPRPRAQTHARPVITAPRTDCRWRRYRDGALGSDHNCAPGALDAAVIGHTARTICNPRWLVSASRPRLGSTTRDRLVIEYQLPGPVTTYVVARVVPVEDGGSPTDPRNLYVLPLNGWGGERTQAVVAERLHSEICAHRLTVAEAVKTLTGNWLSKRVPVD